MDPAVQIQLAPADAAEPWSKTIVELCTAAWQIVEARSGLKLIGPLQITTKSSSSELQKYIGAKITHVVAVASPDRREIVILRTSLFAESPDEQLATMIHEMTHMIIAQHVPGRLPAWIEEGLCMIVAGQEGLGFTWRMTVAGSLGGVLPIGEIERSLLIGGNLQTLAYAQSLSMTKFLIKRTLAEAGLGGDSPREFLKLLADPVEGPKLLKAFANLNWVASLESEWRREHRSIWNWIAILTGTSVLWVFITGLFLIAYWRKKRMSKLAREKMDEDDDYVEYTEDED